MVRNYLVISILYNTMASFSTSLRYALGQRISLLRDILLIKAPLILIAFGYAGGCD